MAIQFVKIEKKSEKERIIGVRAKSKLSNRLGESKTVTFIPPEGIKHE
jgi:hypothetical protein